MIMFKVCRRCLQRFPLRWKKNYERTIHASKYIQKKADPPPNPPQGGILFSYIPWKDSLSGEVGGYPQALPEVVTLREC